MDLCDELEEYLTSLVGYFDEVCRKKSLKVNDGKSTVIVLGGKEGLECEVCVDGTKLDHASEIKYLGCVLDESGTDEAECLRKVVSGKRVAGAIRSLFNARDLQLECAKFLHEAFLYLFLCMAVRQCYGRERRDLGLELYRWTTSKDF